MKRKIALGVAGVSVLAAAGAGTAPAHASTQSALVSFTSTAPPALGGRTLTLNDTSGVTLSKLDLSSGGNGFEAIVSDSNYNDNGFTANATMSNLYGFANGTYNCSQKVLSSQITLNSPSNLLDVNGITGSGIPSITLSGSLTSILPTSLTSLIGGTANVTNMAVTSTVDQAYTESQLAGGATGDLIGAALTAANAHLPISIGSLGTNTNFANPAADPAGANCGVSGASATPVTVENGTATQATVTSDVAGAVNALGSPTTAQTLVDDNYFTASQVMTAVASQLGLSLTQLGPYQSQILGALTPTVGSVGSVEVSGNYDASPIMTVTTPSSIPGGTYQGVLTVTLADGNPPA